MTWRVRVRLEAELDLCAHVLDPGPATRDRSGMPVTPIRPSGKPISPWQLRIELLDVQPLVWRRLLVPSGITLPALHRVFQAALGWTNSHLHEFIINGKRYAEPNPEWADEMKQRDERRVRLEAALGRRSRTFEYLYDFGDDWRHAVVVEDQYMPPRAPFAPVCLAGENACPPEDIGGPPGYAQFLAEGGEAFDPARFDCDAVCRALGRVSV